MNNSEIRPFNIKDAFEKDVFLVINPILNKHF